MDVGIFSYSQGDPLLIDRIVNEFLSQGKFDKLRKECMSDADTKPAYQNLQQRVENTVAQFLKKQIWKPDLNKNQLRDNLKKHVLESNFFDAGINRIVDQVVNPNVLATVFLPEVEEVVYNYLSIPKPLDSIQKKSSSLNDVEKLKPPDSENDNKFNHFREKINDDNKNRDIIQKVQNEMNATSHLKDVSFCLKKENFEESNVVEYSNENVIKMSERLKLQNIKSEDKMSYDAKDMKIVVEQNKNISPTYSNMEKLELASDESLESIPRLAVEKLQISETKFVCPPDSDDSYALEVIEKSMSESRDSEDSIMNQMSPISQGRLTPDISENDIIDEKEEREEKKPLTFIGQIPKYKKDESELSKIPKKEVLKAEKSDLKIIFSSDEDDSNKSYEKSDLEAKKKINKKPCGEGRKKSHKNSTEKKMENYLKAFKDKKSLSSTDKEKNKERNEKGSHKVIKSSPTYSRETYHKSSHTTQQKYSEYKERLHEKKKKEQKKKSKSSDDHGKERSKKNDRRSTDRDSNERDKSSGSRNQSDSRKKEREQKTEENKGEKSHKEEVEMENEVYNRSECEGVVLEMEEDWVAEEGEIVLVNEEWICSKMLQKSELELHSSNKINVNVTKGSELIVEENEAIDFEKLIQAGELALIKFSEPTNDFYVKFNSTGFKYFEEWEKCKLDCEEEFKEFVDEAENNLTLISDDDSELEELNFDHENQRIIDNLLKGISNYKKGLLFNPLTSEFYKWTSSKYYHKFRKKFEKKGCKNSEKNESDESIKENINRNNRKCQNFIVLKGKEKESQAKDEKFLHLKLLNRYKKKALRQGKHRRKYKRRTLNANLNDARLSPNEETLTIKNDFLLTSAVEGLSKTQNSFLRFGTSNVKKTDKKNFNFNPIQSSPETINSSLICAFEREKKMPLENTSILTDSKPENKNYINNLNHYDSKHLKIFETAIDGEINGNPLNDTEILKNFELQKKKRKIRLSTEKQKPFNQISRHKEMNISDTILPEKCHLPPSPESDDSGSEKNGGFEKNYKNKKSIKFEGDVHDEIPRKKNRRNYSQKYENQDLYKPRLMLNSSRTRGRGDRGLESSIIANGTNNCNPILGSVIIKLQHAVNV